MAFSNATLPGLHTRISDFVRSLLPSRTGTYAAIKMCGPFSKGGALLDPAPEKARRRAVMVTVAMVARH